MTSITFDTLEYSKTLQEAGVPQRQAEAIATAQNRAVQEVINAQQFTTKADIFEVKAEIFEVKTEIFEVKAEIQAVENRLETKIAETKHELIKWLVGALLAQTALLVAIISFTK